MKIHPKRMRWLIKRLLWVLAALVLFLIVMGALRYKRKSLVKELKIQIIEDKDQNRFVNEDDVKSILFNKFGHYVEGQTIEKINAKATELALEQDLFIKDAEVYIDALNNVNIKVKQREPILRVMDIEDETYYLDEKGTRIPHSSKYTARNLVATGDVGIYNEAFLDLPENRLNQIFQLAKKILANPFLKAQIEQIHIDHNGEAILVPKLGNHKIYFGLPADNVDDKLVRLQNFYEKALPYEGWEKYKYISLAFDNQIVAKMKEMPAEKNDKKKTN
jgi:cell division protein FtsQ